MKILMIAPEPFFESRGTPFSEFYRIKALTEMGHQVDIVTYPIGEDVNIKGLRIFRSFKPPFIKKIKIGPSFAKIILDLFLFPKAFFKAIFGKYDFIHTHEEGGYLGAFLRKFFRKKHLYDMHSSLPQQMTNFNFTKSKIIIGFVKALENFVLKNSDSIITICPALQEYVLSKYPEANSHLIENFLDEEYEAVNKRINEIKDIFKGKKIALYAGTLEHYQGIDILLESSKYLNNKIGILIVGGREEQIKAYKNEFIFDETKVKFIPQVHKKDVINFIKACDVLLSLRKKGTNTPLKIYSYLKSGKPIVATNILSHSQLLNEKISILVPPNPTKIAEGIREALSEKGKEVAKNALEFSNKHFTKEKYIEKVKKAISIFEKYSNSI